MRSLATGALLLVSAAALLLVAPAASGHAQPLRRGAKCKKVVKIVKGHRKKVKVCKKSKPKPKPPQQPEPVLGADLSVRVTSSLDRVTAGNQVAFGVQVVNKGPDEALSVSVTVDVPAEEVYLNALSGYAPCASEQTASGTRIRCDLPMLKPEGAETQRDSPFPTVLFLSFVAEPEDAGPFAAVARVESAVGDPNPADNEAGRELLVLPGPALADLSVSIASVPDPGSVKGGVANVVSVTNHGPTEATRIFATVLLPQGTSVASFPGYFDPLEAGPGVCGGFSVYPSGPGTALLCLEAVESGETRKATVDLAPSIHAPPRLESTVVVSAYTRDPDLANNRASTSGGLSPFVPPAGVDLAASLTPPASATAGRNFTLPFAVTNFGSTDARDLRFTLTTTPRLAEPPEFWLSGSFGFERYPECTPSELGLECTLSELPSDGRLSGAIFGRVAAPGQLYATLTATSSVVDESPLDNAMTTTFEVKPRPELR